MKYLPRIIHLFLGGFCAIGQYSRAENTTSPTMQKLRKEVESYSRRTDKQALMQDALALRKDARKAYIKTLQAITRRKRFSFFKRLSFYLVAFLLHNRHRYLLPLLLRFVHHLVEPFKGRATI